MKNLRIVFMGTPQFAVASLDILVKNNYNIVGVITAPDKPAGRGKKINQSDVKKYAIEKGLKILQPANLKAADFINELKALKADLQIVVAFRMLPEVVWDMPELGTFNLHGSLLPQYRGAAPINWAIINGEKETGVSTFFLNKQIDTGKIIDKKVVKIGASETAGELHDRLMEIGSELVLKTVKQIECGNPEAIEQSHYFNSEKELKHAPKLNNENCRINWDQKAENIFNHIRGLCPYPAAFTYLKTNNQEIKLKIFRSSIEFTESKIETARLDTDRKKYLRVKCKDAWIYLEDIQLAGKKRMPVQDFLRGFDITNTKILK